MKNSFKIYACLILSAAATMFGQWRNLSFEDLSPQEPSRISGNADVRSTENGAVGPQHSTKVSSLSVMPSSGLERATSELVSDEFEVIAKRFNNDENKILEFVWKEVKTEFYYGMRKGPLLTLHERSGNDFDKAALALKLLEVSGHSGKYAYLRGWKQYSMRKDSADSVFKWLGFQNEDSSQSVTVNELNVVFSFLSGQKIPHLLYGQTEVAISRIFLTKTEDGRVYDLSDQSKVYASGTPVVAGYDTFFNAAKKNAALKPSGIAKLNKAELGNSVESLALTLKDNRKEIDEVIGRFKLAHETKDNFNLVSLRDVYLQGKPGLTPTEANSQLSDLFSEGYAPYYIGDSIFGFAFSDPKPADYVYMQFSISAPDSDSEPLPLLTDDSEPLRLRLAEMDGKQLYTKFEGSIFSLVLGTENMWSSGERTDGDVILNCEVVFPQDTAAQFIGGQAAGAEPLNAIKSKAKFNIVQNDKSVCLIAYVFTPSKTFIDKIKHDMDERMFEYKRLGYVDKKGDFVYNENGDFGSVHVEMTAMCLNVMALEWMRQTNRVADIVGRAYGCEFQFFSRLGRVAQECSADGKNTGFFIDIPDNAVSIISSSGNFKSINDKTYNVDAIKAFQTFGMYISALEHTVIQQLQGQEDAVSTVNILSMSTTDAANEILCASTEEEVDSLFAAYSEDTRGEFKKHLQSNTNASVIAPKKASLLVPNDWVWSGNGYMAFSEGEIGMIISGGYSGGYSAVNAAVSPALMMDFITSSPAYHNISAINNTDQTQFNQYASTTAQKYFGADPVDLFSGAFTYDVEDIVIGDALEYTRHYNSNMAHSDAAGLGNGWVHSYYSNLQPLSDSEFVLSPESVNDAAYLIASICAVKSLLDNHHDNLGSDAYSNQTKAINLASAAVIAGIGVDKIINNSIFIQVGKETMVFRKEVGNDFDFEPLQGQNTTLRQTSYIHPTSLCYLLETWGGNAMVFGLNPRRDKFVLSLIYRQTKPLALSYDTDDNLTRVNSLLNNRYLDFKWNADKTRITNVKYRYGTNVSYNYSILSSSFPSAKESAGDLTAVTDEGGKIWTYDYDEFSRIVELRNPKNELIVKNFYNADSKVWKQLSGGDENKPWFLVYNEGETLEIDPLGNTKKYGYGKSGECVYIEDQLGNRTENEYDEHLRITKTILPNKNEVRMTYDEWHNVLTENLYEKSGEDYNWLAGKLNIYTDHKVHTYKGNITGAVYIVNELPRLKKSIRCDAEGSTTGRVYEVVEYWEKQMPTISSVSYPEKESRYNLQKRPFPTKTIDENGVVTTYTYNNYGFLAYKTVGGHTTKYNFTDYEVPLGESGPGFDVAYSINANMDLAYTKDALFMSESKVLNYTPPKNFIYDSGRRLVGVHSPASKFYNQIEYPEVRTLIEYDDADNVIRTVDEDGVESTFTWDFQGKKLSESLGSGEEAITTRYEYDLADRHVRTIFPDGRILENVLDAAGRTVSSTLNGRTTTYEYDEMGRTLKVTSPTGITLETSYDGSGNLIAAKDGRGNITEYTYNAFGECVKTKLPNGGVSETALDLDAKTITYKTPEGRTSTVQHEAKNWYPIKTIPYSGESNATVSGNDLAGRPTYIADSLGGITFKYEYAKLTGVYEGTNTVRPTASVKYEYDTMMRIKSSDSTKLVPPSIHAPSRKVSYTYTPGGKLKTLTYPTYGRIGARTVTYDYNSLGLLSEITDWNQRKTYYSYDSIGRLEKITRPNGSYRILKYQSGTGLLKSIEERKSNGEPIMVHVYRYDDENRIIADVRLPQNTEIDRAGYNATYNLDNQMTSWLWNGVERLPLAPQYDLDGNMLRGPLGETEEVDYQFDARGRLTECKGITYVYDIENNLDEMIMPVPAGEEAPNGATTYKYSHIYSRAGEMNDVLMRNRSAINNGKEVSTQSTYYVYGAGLEYEVTIDATGKETDIKYYHFDHLGSTVALSDNTENVTDRWSYDTWGYNAHTEGSSDTPFLYVGAYGIQSHPNGLVHMRARFYNPTTKSFITEDPAQDGTNWYLYASGSPMMRVDPGGLSDGAFNQFIDDQQRWPHQRQAIFDMYRQIWDTPERQLLRAVVPFVDTYARLQMGELSDGEAGFLVIAETLTFIPVGRAVGTSARAGAQMGKAALKIYSAASDGARTVNHSKRFWSKTTFQGKRIYQRNDLIDPNLLDKNGVSNLERMKAGKAPIGPDGEFMNLHHTIQSNDSPLAEVTQTFHRQHSSILHINPNSVPSGVNRNKFGSFRRKYWRWRATQF